MKWGISLRTCHIHTGAYVSRLASNNRLHPMPPREPDQCLQTRGEKKGTTNRKRKKRESCLMACFVDAHAIKRARNKLLPGAVNR